MPCSDTELPDDDFDDADDDWSLDDERTDDVVELHASWATDRGALDC
jgi:hypothetical protein